MRHKNDRPYDYLATSIINNLFSIGIYHYLKLAISLSHSVLQNHLSQNSLKITLKTQILSHTAIG